MVALIRPSALCLIAIAAVGCTSDADAPTARSPRYGTADASLLVLGEGNAPSGLDLIEEVSGPQSVYQFAKNGDRISHLLAHNAQGGFTQYFGVTGSGPEDAEAVAPLNATKLNSRSLIFPNRASAASALTFLSTNPHPGLTHVEVNEEPRLDPSAYFQRSRSTSAHYAAYSWQADNAVIVVGAEMVDGQPNEFELRKLARTVKEAIEVAEPTGAALDVPGSVEPGSPIFDQTFDRAALRQETFAIEPAGLSRYVDGGFQIGTDSSGGRYRDTSEFEDRALALIGDGIVEADVELVQGTSVRWGLQCRIDEEGGFYLFLVGSDGYAAIFRASSFSDPFYALAEVQDDDAIRRAVASRRHHLQAECMGDEIARLGLHLNGELLLEAYDDDPILPGAAGMWIESREGPAAALFDNFKVSPPEAP